MAQAEISPLTRQQASTFFVLQTKLLRNMFPGVTKNKLQFTWSLRHLYGKVPSVSNYNVLMGECTVYSPPCFFLRADWVSSTNWIHQWQHFQLFLKIWTQTVPERSFPRQPTNSPFPIHMQDSWVYTSLQGEVFTSKLRSIHFPVFAAVVSTTQAAFTSFKALCGPSN